MSAVADMPEDRAINLVNLFPENGRVTLRGGYSSHKTGMAAEAVESLIVWNGPTSSKMFAACDGDVFDATTAGAVGAAALTGNTSDRWQYENISTSAGHFIFMANGADTAQTYNGTTWADVSITGVAEEDVIDVCLHKRRLFLLEKDSLSAWYLDVNSIGGTATELPLGSYFARGGYLQALGTWSRDGGDGPDDYIAFITSEGEAAIYAGTDPASATTWGLVGIFYIGEPIGRRCLIKFGADLGVITVDGVISLAAMAVKDRVQSEKAAITPNIRDAFNSAAALYKTNFGWEIVGYPSARWLFINVPLQAGSQQQQFVMNSLTGAWCRFEGMNANCWAILNEKLYFGGNSGIVYQADSGFSDAGVNIPYRCQWAYNYLRNDGLNKFPRMMRLLIESNGSVTPSVALNMDYTTKEPTQTPSFSGVGLATWDVSKWDEASWGGDDSTQKQWISVGGEGRCVSCHIKGAVKGLTFSIVGFDLVYSTGAPL
jgi:hypothetical protein